MGSRMNKWIYTRLWKAKIAGNTIRASLIIFELNKNFNLGITDENFVGKQNLRHKIDKIRKAVNKKFARREKIYESLSLKFSVPARMVMRWSEGKLINLSNPNDVKRICKILREREFYLDFGDDFCEKQIPININESLYHTIDNSEDE